MARGFYSLVQYCPNRFRAEAVNVGLVLLRQEPHAVRVRMTTRYDRLRKLFEVTRPQLKDLKLTLCGLKSRIENSTGEFRTSEELAAFAASRANDLRLTEPRLAKLADIEQDFDRLFSELVDDSSTRALAEASSAEVLPARLNEVFGRLFAAHKIWTPGKIIVPVYSLSLDIPYAYRNGVTNLVKPHLFSESTKNAAKQAATLAVNGDLIQRHRIDEEEHKLIVVSTQETPEQAKEIDEHVEPLFKEYKVKLVRPCDVDAFATEVERTAH